MSVCKQCGVSFVLLSKSKSHKKGYCSYPCFRRTDEYKHLYVRTYVSNLGRDVISMSQDDIQAAYSEDRARLAREGLSKKRETMRDRYGSVTAGQSKAGRLGRRKLMEERLYSTHGNAVFDMPYEDLSLFYKRVAYEGYGNKIIQGAIASYGSYEAFRDAKNLQLHEHRRSALEGQGFNTSHLNSDQVRKLYAKTPVPFAKGTNSVVSWKRTHLVNQLGLLPSEVNALSEGDVAVRYTEYLSERLQGPPEVDCGYRRTKKGWFSYVSGYRAFYRSSWELDVFQTLDVLLASSIVDEVCPPPRVPYEYGGATRHYYPDGAYILAGSLIVFEVKPHSKVTEPKNQAKFKAATALWGDLFLVLTEHQIKGALVTHLTEVPYAVSK